MSITAKPTSYTVNTAHAKCPDNLWLCDAGSGTSLADQGKVGGLALTLQNADMWTTDAGDLGSAVIACDAATSRYARRTGYTMPSSSALWIAICKPASDVNPVVAAAMVSVAISDAPSVTFGYLGFESSTGKPTLLYDYGTNSSGNRVWATDLYDTSWHMLAGMVRGSTTARPIKKLSVDGSVWSQSASYVDYTFPYDAGGAAPNAIGIGCRPALTTNSIFSGKILAVMVWDDIDWDTVDDAWIASLYANPWQFLTEIATVTITNADDETFYNGESITITGTGFGASQGTGLVKISPTNNVADGAAVTQTVTAWSDTSITISTIKGTPAFGATAYLFVKNDGASSNAAGYAVSFISRGSSRTTLLGLG